MRLFLHFIRFYIKIPLFQFERIFRSDSDFSGRTKLKKPPFFRAKRLFVFNEGVFTRRNLHRKPKEGIFTRRHLHRKRNEGIFTRRHLHQKPNEGIFTRRNLHRKRNEGIFTRRHLHRKRKEGIFTRRHLHQKPKEGFVANQALRWVLNDHSLLTLPSFLPTNRDSASADVPITPRKILIFGYCTPLEDNIILHTKKRENTASFLCNEGDALVCMDNGVGSAQRLIFEHSKVWLWLQYFNAKIFISFNIELLFFLRLGNKRR